MGHPGYWTPPPPAPPPRKTTDVTISVIVLVLTVFIGGAGAVMGLFSLAFLDYCPPATCSVDAAVTAVVLTVAVAALIGLVGLIVTIVRLGQRKTAWPFAVGTMAGCIVVLFAGAVAYTAAVG